MLITFYLFIYLIFKGSHHVHCALFVTRRSLFKGKRLNIFTATPDEEKVESAVGNWIFFFLGNI